MTNPPQAAALARLFHRPIPKLPDRLARRLNRAAARLDRALNRLITANVDGALRRAMGEPDTTGSG
ncbi:hypothetical protein GCM10010495_65070 [Kitasatospora herbaricolor]|uniref:hypothetical protein n=1 Tax=Kitasatospora herbaricolor TaxID=68217 RepID=UPI00174D0E72|nr:hypothetical protein [Kitasatospora herbaricolor]MDQ0312624.1 putative transcriptional regulator [Kitasatospora herbaricolor]GGV38719.1 hypothetical protein GCM10010495_65070 [Kitasatospora herbaricolor]